MYSYRISLSRFRYFARIILLIYIMTLGVAMASSVIKSDKLGMNVICTSTGYKFIKQSGDKSQDSGQAGHLLDCSLCLASGLPATWPQTELSEPPHSLSYTTRSIPAARLASIVAAPLPARGPPVI